MKPLILTSLLAVLLGQNLCAEEPAIKENSHHYVFSMNCKAQTVVEILSKPEERAKAIQAFKECGVEKVYVESYRSRVFASEELLRTIKKEFNDAGFEVQCVIVPTKLNDRASVVPCFTDSSAAKRLREIAERSAAVFDTLLFDDFLFTDCQCDECKRQKGDQSWGDFRSKLISKVVAENLVKPAKAVNPNVKLIIKFPCWYEGFHDKGYDFSETAKLFDETWAGTETRDLNPRIPQPQAFWLQNWMCKIGKCGGGWFDPLTCSPETFVEQARNTILGGAPETLLHCYDYIYLFDRTVANEWGSGLPKDLGVAKAFQREKEGLRRLAEMIDGLELKGYALPKKPNVDQSGLESQIHGFILMLGIPCVAATTLPQNQPTIFCAHTVHFEDFEKRLTENIFAKIPVLITNSTVKNKNVLNIPDIVHEMSREASAKTTPCVISRDNVHLIRFDKAWDLENLPNLDILRNSLLKFWNIEMNAPFGVSLTLFEGRNEKLEVLQNFNNTPATVRIKFDGKERRKSLSLPDSNAASIETLNAGEYQIVLSPRAIIVLESEK